MPELRPHQAKVVAMNPAFRGLFFEMRVGKTPTSIRLACKNLKNCLVITPKPIKEQWEDEINLWKDSDTKFTVITKEQFKLAGLVKYTKANGKPGKRFEWQRLPHYDGIIWDEVHLGGCNYKSDLFNCVDDYIKGYKIKFFWPLSGTPYTNDSWSVYSLGMLLGKNWNWYQWKKRYFYDVHMGYKTLKSGRKVPNMIPVQKDKKSKSLAAWLENEMKIIVGQLGIVIKLADVVDLPEQMFRNEYFDLNAEQKRIIKEKWDPIPVVRYTAQHQIESGTFKGDEYSESIVISKCEKNERIIELCAENKKIAIVGRYNLYLSSLKQTLSHKFPNRKIYIINGLTANKNEIVNQIHEDDDCIVLIQAMCSVGYSLRSISVMVFASMDFSFPHYTQMCSRLNDMRKKEPNLYIHLLTRGKSVDRGVYDAVMKKSNFDAAIFERYERSSTDNKI